MSARACRIPVSLTRYFAIALVQQQPGDRVDQEVGVLVDAPAQTAHEVVAGDVREDRPADVARALDVQALAQPRPEGPDQRPDVLPAPPLVLGPRRGEL